MACECEDEVKRAHAGPVEAAGKRSLSEEEKAVTACRRWGVESTELGGSLQSCVGPPPGAPWCRALSLHCPVGEVQSTRVLFGLPSAVFPNQ